MFGFGESIDHGLLLRDIDSDRHDPFVGAGETMSRPLDRIFLDIGHNHVRTSFGQRCRNAETDAGSGAGDDGSLAGDVLHSQGPFEVRIAARGPRPSRHRSAKDADGLPPVISPIS